MLWTIFMILLVLWLIGFVTGHAFGGYVHMLLIAAAVVLVIQLFSRHRTV
ncbi:MAG TPA: lmo0937 family membrane protein [Blastocatellia bacterium]|nr:lmo0937 family membrane protein [Blastocatellia bacterium]